MSTSTYLQCNQVGIFDQEMHICLVATKTWMHRNFNWCKSVCSPHQHKNSFWPEVDMICLSFERCALFHYDDICFAHSGNIPQPDRRRSFRKRLWVTLLSSTRAESARAVTGRQCPHSGVGEDFLARRPGFFTKMALTRKWKVKNRSEGWKWLMKNLHKGYKIWGRMAKIGNFWPKTEFTGPKKRENFLGDTI